MFGILGKLTGQGHLKTKNAENKALIGSANGWEDETTWEGRDYCTQEKDYLQSRTGTRRIITEQFDQTSQGDRLVSRDLISFMRSRNVQFVAKRVKPSTRLYAFFDGRDVTQYCVPKLLEISMASGVFQIGETVTGTTRPIGGAPQNDNLVDPSIRFRVAQSNHMEGPYNAPTKRYGASPYSAEPIPATYSSTSTILNVDTFSLADQPQGSYWGWVEDDMILVGETSGAIAVVTNVRLVSDIGANLLGSFYIPDPDVGSTSTI